MSEELEPIKHNGRPIRKIGFKPLIDEGMWILEIWDTGRIAGGSLFSKMRLSYCFSSPEGEVIFEGDDFGCAPLHDPASDDAARALLGFLTLKPGDVEKEYFDSYTPQQLRFALSYQCEALAAYADRECDWSEDGCVYDLST